MQVMLLRASHRDERRRQWQRTPALLPGKSHGRRSLAGCSPWGLKESDTTEQLHCLFSLSCIGEGNGNPLQSSWLENPRDDRAWWAAVYGAAQSRTRLKRLSSSSSIEMSSEFWFRSVGSQAILTSLYNSFQTLENWIIDKLIPDSQKAEKKSRMLTH